jgi:hypothetical protein
METFSNPSSKLPGNKLQRSAAYRSSLLYRGILALFPPPSFSVKPLAAIPLLTMTGRRHLPMLEQCLYALARSASRVPPLTVVSDGTIAAKSIARRLAWWPMPLTVASPETYLEWHTKRGRTSLVQLTQRDPFGLKLAAILAHAEQEAVVWCDTDILFFSDYQQVLPPIDRSGRFMLAAEDWLYAYDRTLTDSSLKHLLSLKPVNSGFLLAQGEFYDSCGLERLIKSALTSGNIYTEQTIIAEITHQAGHVQWGLDAIRIFDTDKFTLAPTFSHRGWTARHYVTPIRHLFWRDALALRCGVGP